MVGKQPLRSYFGVPPHTAEGNALRLLLETGIHLIDADEGSLLAYDPARRVLRFAMTAGNRNAERALLGQAVPVGKGLSGLAAATGEVQIGAPTYHDIAQTRRRRGEPDEPEAVIAAPIMAGETLLGVITAVSFRDGRRFSHDDGKLMGRFGAIAGLVLDQHRRLHGAVRPNGGATGKEKDARKSSDAPERAILASIEKLRRNRPDLLPQFARAVGMMATLILREPEGHDGRE
jgi:GAF domain-containing protein